MTDPDDILGRWVRNTDPNHDPITGTEVRAHAAHGDLAPPRGGSHRGRWVLATAACVLVAVAVGAAVLTRGNDDGQVVTTGPADSAGGATEGAATVQLEPIEGAFTEGFDVGLRFETRDGEVIASTLWSDFVAASGGTDLRDYYDSVLTQAVPAGTVIVRAEVSIGAGPPPVPPDLESDLPCRLAVDVAPGETVAVEVLFNEDNGCLRPFNGSSTTTTTALSGPTIQPVTPLTSATTSPADVPPTTASSGELSLGFGYYVDVDLDCRAFEFSGIWVLVDGDPRSWQPPDERHEGGTFTLDTPTTGTFSGDAAGTKVATFRLLPADEEPGCMPTPR